MKRIWLTAVLALALTANAATVVQSPVTAANPQLACADLSNSAATCSSAAVGGVTGLGTGIATWLATPSSSNLLSALTDETGTGNAVFSASPTLTGTITAAAETLSSTLTYAAGEVRTGIVTSTGDVTVASTTRYQRCNKATAIAVTLPTSSMVVGQVIDVFNVGAGACTVDSGSAHTINAAQTYVLSSQYQSVSLLCTAISSGVCTAWDAY